MKFCIRRPLALLAFLITVILGPTSFGAFVISNAATGGNVNSFGRPNTLTYGQVFTAPVTGTLDSFTLHLNGFAGDIKGGVGLWNGPSAFAFGHGISSNLYLSNEVTTAPSASAYTFTPAVNVVAGNRYVAYITAFGIPGSNATTSMPLGTTTTDINYFVWNNTSDPVGNQSWNYFSNLGSALFSASFSSNTPVIPEPSSFTVFGCLLICASSCRFRRKS